MATAKKAAPAKKAAATKSAAAKKSTATKKTAAKSDGAAKKSARKTGASGGQGRANAAFMKAMKPSPELAAVVGDKPMPRTEVTKKLWAYIKSNNLQDPKERRMINADDKLKAVFGGKKQVSMFDMTKLVNQHLSEG